MIIPPSNPDPEQAKYMASQVAGMDVPEAIVARMAMSAAKAFAMAASFEFRTP